MTHGEWRTEIPARGQRVLHATLSVLLACALALGGATLTLASPSNDAWADETTDTGGASTGTTATETDAEPDEFQKKVEETSAAYDAATARVEELTAQIADNEAKIAELEEAIPDQQERTASAMRVLYKAHNDPMALVNCLLGTESITDFLSTVDGLSYIHESNVEEVERLNAIYDELETIRQDLAAAKQEADEQQAAAKQALEEAQAAREEAQRKAREKAAQEAAEAAAAAESLAQAQAASEELAAARAASEAAALAAESSDGANWSSDKESFVSEWGTRIDAYLEGSPLAGLGRTFAEAAWTYGVDPRWSPAISNTESSKGRYCFKSHNAWGWGSSSWDSWEEAIDAHVAGLARGYGYTISVSAAKKYCPPNWQNWYNNTLAQMNSI